MSLQFSDTSTSKNGLIQECEVALFGDDGYGKISGNANRLATFTRYLNEAMNQVAKLVFAAGGRWQWDDNNQTDYPIATTTLVTTAGSEQQDYPFNSTHLVIERVEVKNSAGGWEKLNPIDQSDLFDTSLTNFLNTPGMPRFYDKMANSLFLYPKPLAASVTAASGLKIWFQRPPSYFTITDTTKVPGFNSLYHRLVALIASRDYALLKTLKNAKGLVDLVEKEEGELKETYSLRNKDEHAKLSVKRGNFK